MAPGQTTLHPSLIALICPTGTVSHSFSSILAHFEQNVTQVIPHMNNYINYVRDVLKCPKNGNDQHESNEITKEGIL